MGSRSARVHMAGDIIQFTAQVVGWKKTAEGNRWSYIPVGSIGMVVGPRRARPIPEDDDPSDDEFMEDTSVDSALPIMVLGEVMSVVAPEERSKRLNRRSP